MGAKEHKDYKEELERCDYTLDYVNKTLEKSISKKDKLDSNVDKLKKHQSSDSSGSYVDLMVNSLLQDSLALKVKNLYEARKKPYFARIDFVEEGKVEAEKLYIGKMSLMTEEDQKVIIVDWRAPVANLYYDSRLGEASYECLGGSINGKLTLKRQFSINDGVLNEIFDIDVTTNDEFLQNYLGAGTDNRLKEIASTIQEEQNNIIRADMWSPLIVQGAAGSGKTTIALHRIAYLIYTMEKSLKPENFMIIAPSKFFLNYISEVLPDLGVDQVVQTTFESFSSSLLKKKFKVEDPNDKLAFFISEESDEAKNKIKEATKFKTSIVFKNVLDRYVQKIEEDFIPKEDLKISEFLVMEYVEINRIFLDEYKRLPLAIRINEVKKHLKNKLDAVLAEILKKLNDSCDAKVYMYKYKVKDEEKRKQAIIDALDTRDKRIDKAKKLAKNLVPDYIKKISKISPWQYYNDLLDNEELFLELSSDLTEKNIALDLIKYSKEKIKSGVIEVEDFAPLTYLKYLIYGIDEKMPIKQIIIDEAQDFSVFQLYALKMILKDSSFTILGDLCQGIYSYRGIQDWETVLNNVYSHKKAKYLKLEQTYRTTIEIMELGNRISELMEGINVPKAVPVVRHGEKIRFIKSKKMKEKTIDLINEIKSTGNNSIAIICKTKDECVIVHSYLKKKLDNITLITGNETVYNNDIKIVPSYLSKGLEFDNVILYGVDNFKYVDIEIKLLYVSVTRALHNLFILYENQTKLIETIQNNI